MVQPSREADMLEREKRGKTDIRETSYENLRFSLKTAPFYSVYSPKMASLSYLISPMGFCGSGGRQCYNQSMSTRTRADIIIKPKEGVTQSSRFWRLRHYCES